MLGIDGQNSYQYQKIYLLTTYIHPISASTLPELHGVGTLVYPNFVLYGGGGRWWVVKACAANWVYGTQYRHNIDNDDVHVIFTKGYTWLELLGVVDRCRCNYRSHALKIQQLNNGVYLLVAHTSEDYLDKAGYKNVGVIYIDNVLLIVYTFRQQNPILVVHTLVNASK